MEMGQIAGFDLHPKVLAWMREQERLTIYYMELEGQWYMEWFNQKGGFDFRSGSVSINKFIEEIINDGK